MGAAGVCDRRMSSGCYCYTRLALVISRLSECMGFDSCPQRFELPLGRYNQRCWIVNAGCRESSLSRVEVSRKGGHTNLPPTISEAVLNAEMFHTRHVSALWNGLSGQIIQPSGGRSMDWHSFRRTFIVSRNARPTGVKDLRITSERFER